MGGYRRARRHQRGDEDADAAQARFGGHDPHLAGGAAGGAVEPAGNVVVAVPQQDPSGRTTSTRRRIGRAR